MLATLLSQAISRRFQLADARRKRRLENLQLIRVWVEAYRVLFRCKYPTLYELVFAHRFLDPHVFSGEMVPLTLLDGTAPLRVYDALVEYRDARVEYEKAEELGLDVLEALGARRRFPGAGYFAKYPRGLPSAIGPYLDKLAEYEHDLFATFPSHFCCWIDWDKLDYTKPAEVRSIIHTYLNGSHLSDEETLRERDLGDARHDADRNRDEQIRR